MLNSLVAQTCILFSGLVPFAPLYGHSSWIKILLDSNLSPHKGKNTLQTGFLIYGFWIGGLGMLGGIPLTHWLGNRPPTWLYNIGLSSSVVGVALGGVAVQVTQVWLLYAGWLLVGLGVGCSLGPVLGSALQWFGRVGRTGICAGLCGLFIGLWSAILAAITPFLNEKFGIAGSFYAASIGVLVCGLPASFTLKNPEPRNDTPEPRHPKETKVGHASNPDSQLSFHDEASTPLPFMWGSITEESSVREVPQSSVSIVPLALHDLAKKRKIWVTWFCCVCVLIPGYGVKYLTGELLLATYNASSRMQLTANVTVLIVYGFARLLAGLIIEIVSARWTFLFAAAFQALTLIVLSLYVGLGPTQGSGAQIAFLVIISLVTGTLGCVQVAIKIVILDMWGQPNFLAALGLVNNFSFAVAGVIGPFTTWVSITEGAMRTSATTWFSSAAVVTILGFAIAFPIAGLLDSEVAIPSPQRTR